MCQVNGWETQSKLLLSVFFDKRNLAGCSYDKEKENYKPLDYLRMEIIEEIGLYFSDGKTQPAVKNY